MAAITSQITSQTMIENTTLQNNINPDSDALTNTTPAQLDADTQNSEEESSSDQNLLSETQAIQQAILAEDFDFSTLQAPAAGNNADQDLSQQGEKTLSSPLLLEDNDLLISFRNDAGLNRTSQPSEIDTDTLDNLSLSDRQHFDEAISPISVNTDDLPSTEQISGFLSEDFVTQTEGSFDADLSISAQTINTALGTFTSTAEGQWNYQLNNSSPDVQSLAAGETVSDRIVVTGNSGEAVELTFSIQGNNDQAVITGEKAGSVQALTLPELADAPAISGKLNVSDIDIGESEFIANTQLRGNFGSAEIDAQGEWQYVLNNNSDAVLGLKAGEKLFDLFSVKTLDGSKQLIQITIEGADDKPILGGNNLGILDLETQLGSSGSLTIADPDFGESSFQEASGIESSLGYGSGSINAQGEWQFNLNHEFTKANPIAQGESQIDSFEVLTADGTSQTILIPIQGSDQPLFAQTPASTDTLQLSELLSNGDALDEFGAQSHSGMNEAGQAAQTLLSSGYHNESGNHFTQTPNHDIGLI